MSRAKRLKELKSRFEESLQEVADMIGASILDVSRDEYVRVSVDTGIVGRLNKEELVEIGGYAKAIRELNIKESLELPKIAVFDLETAPIECYVWSMWNNNIGLNQVIEHTSILSYALKFIGEDKVYYNDVRNKKNIRDDKDIVRELRDLLDRSDFALGHNSSRFDLAKIRYRIIQHKLEPFSHVQEIDTLKIAKKFLGFDSNKLEHLTHSLCTKHKKLSHKKYSGFDLWSECMKGNKEAFEEMEAYNVMDVLSLEELYLDHLAPYDNITPNFSSYNDSEIFRCNCGNDSFKPSGYHITKKSKFEKFKCSKCGKTHRSSVNLHSKEKRSSLLV